MLSCMEEHKTRCILHNACLAGEKGGCMPQPAQMTEWESIRCAPVGASSMMPSLRARPNSFQKVAYFSDSALVSSSSSPD